MFLPKSRSRAGGRARLTSRGRAFSGKATWTCWTGKTGGLSLVSCTWIDTWTFGPFCGIALNSYNAQRSRSSESDDRISPLCWSIDKSMSMRWPQRPGPGTIKNGARSNRSDWGESINRPINWFVGKFSSIVNRSWIAFDCARIEANELSNVKQSNKYEMSRKWLEWRWRRRRTEMRKGESGANSFESDKTGEFDSFCDDEQDWEPERTGWWRQSVVDDREATNNDNWPSSRWWLWLSVK